jgi:hypothetical protein
MSGGAVWRHVGSAKPSILAFLLMPHRLSSWPILPESSGSCWQLNNNDVIQARLATVPAFASTGGLDVLALTIYENRQRSAKAAETRRRS